MPIDFPSFPELVQEKILDRLDCYDLYNFSETSKWSRSLSIRPAKRHEGTIWVSLVHNEKRLKLSYESSSHPQSDIEVILEFKDSKFENLEKYLSVRHSTLFANVTIYLSYWCSAPFESTFITFDRMTQLGYPIVGCGVNGVMSNEAIVRVLMTFRKAERVNMGFRPTGDFTNFDFVTPFPESLENELLEIRYSKWVSPWLINNAFNKCREVKLFDHYFVESDVIEILKSWRTGSSIRKLLLFFDLDGSIEDFGAKMIEINAAPVQEAFLSISQKRARLRGYVSSAWLLKQNNTGAEVLVTVGSFSHNGTHKQFHMKDEFETKSKFNKVEIREIASRSKPHINTLRFPESHQHSNDCFVAHNTIHTASYDRITELGHAIESDESRFERCRAPVTKIDRHIGEKSRMPNAEILFQVFKFRILEFQYDFYVGLRVT